MRKVNEILRSPRERAEDDEDTPRNQSMKAAFVPKRSGKICVTLKYSGRSKPRP